MNRRDFTVVGLSGAAAAIGGLAFGQQSRVEDSSRAQVKRADPKRLEVKSGDVEKHRQHGEQMLACAKACSECQHECDACATHCAHKLAEGKKDHLATLMTCRDCADFCAAAAQIVARGGPFAAMICQPCAEACAACAKECDKFPDDEHMKRCAEECRTCEKACREMVKHHGHDHARSAK